jgi:hypothetical protein
MKIKSYYWNKKGSIEKNIIGKSVKRGDKAFINNKKVKILTIENNIALFETKDKNIDICHYSHIKKNLV